MNVFRLAKKIIILLLIIQFIAFVYVKQKFSELERKNAKLENQIGIKMNENNLLKIKLTTSQNQYKLRKLVEQHLTDYKVFKPNQIIEKEKI
jgi:hypothetical protein